MKDDEATGWLLVVMWELLQRELKDQFLPSNTAWVAKESLKKLRQLVTFENM